MRLISATHRDLRDRIQRGLFREDLYYRLKVLDLHIPPLRERRGDLPMLAEHFLNKYSPPGTQHHLSAEAWAAIMEYSFPGNVRELQHAMQRAAVLARGEEIGLHHLPDELAPGIRGEQGTSSASLPPLATAVRAFEREYLLRALRRTSGHRIEAARMLGISRKNLWEKARAMKIERPEWASEPEASPGKEGSPTPNGEARAS